MNKWTKKITFWSISLGMIAQSYAEGGRNAEALGQGGTGPEPELWVLLMTCFTILGLVWRHETQKKHRFKKYTSHGQHQTVGQTID